MTHQDYINKCRFYNEEPQCPYQVMDERRYYWEAEKMYIEMVDDSVENLKDYLSRNSQYQPVQILCHTDDGIDPMQTSFLFTYYENFAGDYHTIDEIIVGFRDWYLQYKTLNK